MAIYALCLIVVIWISGTQSAPVQFGVEQALVSKILCMSALIFRTSIAHFLKLSLNLSNCFVVTIEF